jgi:hypothetical protein
MAATAPLARAACLAATQATLALSVAPLSGGAGISANQRRLAPDAMPINQLLVRL